MEEARQHTALKTEQVALATAYAAGLLAIVIGMILQFTFGGKSLHIGLVVFVASKVVIGVWQMLRPHALHWQQRSTLLTAIYTALWLGAAIFISLPLLDIS